MGVKPESLCNAAGCIHPEAKFYWLYIATIRTLCACEEAAFMFVVCLYYEFFDVNIVRTIVQCQKSIQYLVSLASSII